jgi:hypothetical protein
MAHPNRTKAASAVVVCALVGAGAGIAGSAAAPAKHATRHAGRTPGGRPPFGMHGPPVHADVVVLNKAGNAFITATEDSGVVQSVSGDQLTITEGTPTVTYKTVTLTIPSGAKVYRNFAAASLGDLKANDRAHVWQSSDGTTVMAVDPSVRPPHPDWHRGPRPGGPPPPGPGGPPPPGPGGPPPPGF